MARGELAGGLGYLITGAVFLAAFAVARKLGGGGRAAGVRAAVVTAADTPDGRVHFTPDVPQNYRDWKSTDAALYDTFAWNLIHKGVMLEPDSREPWFICEAHQDLDLGWLEEVSMQAMDEAIKTHGR